MEEYRRDAESASVEENVIGLYDKELEDKMIQEAINNRLLQEGKLEGLKEGKLEGLKEGIISVAKEMLKRNISVEDISGCTGLSKDEIVKLL